MRLNSFSFRRILSLCAASLGASSLSSALSVSLVLAPTRLENVVETRFSSWPERSIATMVLAKVGADLLLAMASISADCWRMPSSKAGAKSSLWILSKAGYWNGRVLGLAKGFEAGSADGAAQATLAKAAV